MNNCCILLFRAELDLTMPKGHDSAYKYYNIEIDRSFRIFYTN